MTAAPPARGLRSGMEELRSRALALLARSDPASKAEGVRAMLLRAEVDVMRGFDEPAGLPGRPARPLLVPPAKVKPRPVNTPEGRATLLHALAHIEFNAINTVYKDDKHVAVTGFGESHAHAKTRANPIRLGVAPVSTITR